MHQVYTQLAAILKVRAQDFALPMLSAGVLIEPTPSPGRLASTFLRQNLYLVVNFSRDWGRLISQFFDEREDCEI